MAIFNSYVKLPDGNQVLSIFFRQQRTAIWHNLVNIWPLVTCFNSSPSKNHLASTQMYRTDCVPKQQPSIFSHGSWIAPSPLSSEQWTGQGACSQVSFRLPAATFHLPPPPLQATKRPRPHPHPSMAGHRHSLSLKLPLDNQRYMKNGSSLDNWLLLKLSKSWPQLHGSSEGPPWALSPASPASVGPGVLQSTAAPPASQLYHRIGSGLTHWKHMAVCQNLVPLVNPKIAGKWMFIPLIMVLIGIDPYPHQYPPT